MVQHARRKLDRTGDTCVATGFLHDSFRSMCCASWTRHKLVFVWIFVTKYSAAGVHWAVGLFTVFLWWLLPVRGDFDKAKIPPVVCFVASGSS